MVYDEFGKFSGITFNEFEHAEKITHIQLEEIDRVISEVKQIEEEMRYLTENHVLIGDMKLAHLLYNRVDHLIGIVDCGLFKKSFDQDLLRQNFIQVNYCLREAFLWADLEGKDHEMWSIDFPEVYDTLDEDAVCFSEILKDEATKYGASTLHELKAAYQKIKFY